MKPSGPGLLFVGRVLITVSISGLVVGLFIFSNRTYFMIEIFCVILSNIVATSHM